MSGSVAGEDAGATRRHATTREPRLPSTPTHPSLRSAALAAAAACIALLACDEGGAESDGAADGAVASASASAADETHAHEDGSEHSHEDGGDHAHEEGEDHAHGQGTHTHAAADTLVAAAALEPGPDARWTGSATLLAVGDSVRVLLSVEGAGAGARHAAELVAGSCDDPGPELASLTPVAAGSSGDGSSQTTVPAGRLGDHAHGAIRLLTPDGAPAACGPVHLSGSEHTHG